MGTHPIFESDFDCLTDMACEQVAWSCTEEWLEVLSLLKSDRFRALKWLKCWNCRMRDSLPVGISATIAVLTGLEQIHKDRDSLVTLFCASGAIVQSIGLLLERLRDSNQPMHILGAEFGIPHWVMEIRHQVAHQVAIKISIDTYESALEAIFDAILNFRRSYWQEQHKTYLKRMTKNEQNFLPGELKALFNLSKQVACEVEEVNLSEIREICRERRYRKKLSEFIVGNFNEFNCKQIDKFVTMFHKLKMTSDILLDLALLRRTSHESDLGLEEDIEEWILPMLSTELSNDFSDHCLFIKLVAQVPRKVSKTILSTFGQNIAKSNMNQGDKDILEKKIERVNSAFDWFVQGDAAPFSLLAKPETNAKMNAVWNVSAENWSSVSPGLREGYDVSALLNDISRTFA